MQNYNRQTLKVLNKCARAFTTASTIGCTITDNKGAILNVHGYGFAECEICKAANKERQLCTQTHMHAALQAERFGGKYIYFCHMGLTCFVSSVFTDDDFSAYITAGPLLMVEKQDFIAYELAHTQNLSESDKKAVINLLDKMPYTPADKIESYSTLLFSCAGFASNINEANRMLNAQNDDEMQGRVSAYILQLKDANEGKTYPFETERELLNSVASGNKQSAQKHLNEIFGYVFFSSGGKLLTVKARIYELLVLISRAAIESGANSQSTLNLTQDYLNTIATLTTPEALCTWLTTVMNKLIDNVFNYSDVKHVDIISKADMFLRENFTNKIGLLDAAAAVNLSPAYFSRIFKSEKGEPFSKHLNRLRVEKSKKLLLNSNIKMADIAQSVGFEDQSYFTKVFKNIVGVSPLRYKEAKGRV